MKTCNEIFGKMLMLLNFFLIADCAAEERNGNGGGNGEQKGISEHPSGDS